jgi:hypothetical protein
MAVSGPAAMDFGEVFGALDFAAKCVSRGVARGCLVGLGAMIGGLETVLSIRLKISARLMVGDVTANDQPSKFRCRL